MVRRASFFQSIVDMICIRFMNLNSLDLNLLVALDALLREGSVSRAAMRIGLSQPAASPDRRSPAGAIGGTDGTHATGAGAALPAHARARSGARTVHSG